MSTALFIIKSPVGINAVPAGTHVHGLQGEKSVSILWWRESRAAGVTSSKSTVEYNIQQINCAAFFNTKVKLLYAANYWKICSRGRWGFLKWELLQ